MVTVPMGEIDPFTPALALIINVLRTKAAVTEVLLFMVKEQVGEVPLHPPDHPAKFELESGLAVRVTPVPAIKPVPAGLLETVPVPVPLLDTFKVYTTGAD
jgi:hypothetical protein